MPASSDAEAIVEAIFNGQPIPPAAGRVDWLHVVGRLGNGPFAADLFLAICGCVPSPESIQAVTAMMRDVTDVAAAQEIAAVICSGTEVPAPLRRPCFDALCAVAFHERNRHYGARAATLKGALYLAQGRPSLLRYLQGELIDLPLDDDSMFLRHAASVAGVIASHVEDPALVDLLHSLASIPDARDEAAFGLGTIALARAFGCKDRADALAAFDDARRWFCAVREGGMARADAALFASALDVLLEFGAGGMSEALQRLCARVEERFREYLMANALSKDRPPDLSWVGSKAFEASHWALLSAKVGLLASNLRLPAWLDAVRVIEEQLFFVLCASRTIFQRDAHGAIEKVIGPIIEATLLRERAQLSILDQWLESRSTSEWREDAIRLRERIDRRLEASVSGNPMNATADEGTVVALIDAASLPAEMRAEAVGIVDAATLYFGLKVKHPLAHEIVDDLVRDLRRNPDFQAYEETAWMFVAVLVATINFVIACDNAQDGIYNRFLFEWSGDPPRERALHDAYVHALRLGGFSNLFAVEPQDVGGGRADVQFLWRGNSFVVECKRSFEEVSNLDLIMSFGGQLMAYQSTNLTFSALLALDLFDRGGLSPHIRERVGVEFVSPPNSETTYAFVVFRVQGNRKSPSKIKLPVAPTQISTPPRLRA